MKRTPIDSSSVIKYIIFGCVLLVWSCQTKKARKDPNILIIVTDDQGYGDVGYNGNEIIETPVLDELATRSIILDRFYVSPVCAPTRASLLTGKYHLSTGVSWVTHRKDVMRKDALTIAEYLKEKGYQTGLFGKWHNGVQYPHDPIGQGFDVFIGFKEGHFNNYFNPVLNDGFNERQFEGYLPDIITEEAIKFMSKGEGPSLTMVTYNTPHSPFQVPGSYFHKYKGKGLDDRLASIYGMVENIDQNVGKLIQELERSGKLDNTLIFFVGDNGPNGHRYNGGLKGIKSHVDEGGVRVPALLSYPKLGWDTGQRVWSLTAHIDLLPTIAALLGDDGLSEFDGTDLKPIIEGKTTDRTFFTHQVVRQFDRYPGAVREANFLLTIKQGINALYDLNSDPEQTKNLAQDMPEQVNRLRAKYDQWVDQSIRDLGAPELIETGHEVFKHVPFQAQEVTSRTHVDFQGKEGWANDYLIHFSDSSLIEWQTLTVEESLYEVELQLASQPGTVLTLTIDDQQMESIIEQKLDKNLKKSPDRVERGEVYEYDWPVVELGQVTLIPGEHTIRLTTENPQQLEIKSLQLIKSDGKPFGSGQ